MARTTSPVAATTSADRGRAAGLRRPVVALLAASTVSVLALTGCGGSSPESSTQPTGSVSAAAAVSTATAEAARTRALSATRALRSYVFISTSTLNGHQVVVRGRAVLPDRLALTFVGPGAHEDMVKLGHVTYVKVGSAPWKQASMATKATSPLAGLLAALAASQGLTLDGAGQLKGQLSVKDATHLGLVAAGSTTQPLRVMFGLDRAGHVTGFSLAAIVTGGGRSVALTQTTGFTQFDQAPAVTAPI